jgi:peptide/nickel transport system permease protein
MTDMPEATNTSDVHTATRNLSASGGPARQRLALAALRRFARNRGALGGAILMGIILLGAVIGPRLTTTSPLAFSAATLVPPSLSHVMGTDQYGRDILVRVLYGGQNTLLTSLIAVAIGMAIGVSLGLLAGYAGRWIDALLMFAMDVMLAFPGLILILTVVTILGAGTVNVQIAIGISLIPVYVRLVRGVVFSTKEQTFVEAARALGCSPVRVVGRYLLPNLLTPILVLSTTALGWAIVAGAGVSYLGLSVQLPAPDWGLDLSQATNYLSVAWWMAFPGLLITLSVLSVNLIGDGLQAALDPKLRFRA